jgi:nucleoside-diphosphate-sugar epimerase
MTRTKARGEDLTPSRLLILGTGYVGRYLYAAAKERGARVWATSRHPGHNLPQIEENDRLAFDLARPETWPGLPSECDVIWCFPAQPFEQVRDFAETLQSASRRLLILGSTSAYTDTNPSRTFPPPWVDESAPIDETRPRVQGEEYLRTRCGAIVLRVAGIYGPGRNPLNWIRHGRVAPSHRYVNLIHVEDLAAICLELCLSSPSSEVYNVSDGIPRTWSAICRMAQTEWAVTPLSESTRDDPGKRIDTAKLRRSTEYVLQYPNLYAALRAIEPPARPPQNTFA